MAERENPYILFGKWTFDFRRTGDRGLDLVPSSFSFFRKALARVAGKEIEVRCVRNLDRIRISLIYRAVHAGKYVFERAYLNYCHYALLLVCYL